MTRRRGTSLIAVAVLASIALAGCLGEGGSGVLGGGPAAADRGQELPGDPYVDVAPNGQVKEFDIWMDPEAVIEPFEGREMIAFAFSDSPDAMGTVPGPEIRVTQGDTVRVNLHDPHNLEGHTMHWHGVDVPWRSDGVPFLTQDVSATFPEEGTSTYTYEFVAKQPGTYWYHCVFAFPAHADSGMFGALIVEPSDGPKYRTDRDQTLIFHEMDSQWLAAGAWAINPNQDPNPDTFPNNPVDLVDSAKNQARTAFDLAGIVAGEVTGYYGTAQGPRDYYPTWSPRYRPTYDTFMINGQSYPNTEPVYIREGENVRLRLINAGQLHKSIHLHGHHVLVTHVDGYPLPVPHWEDTVNLAPGERKDVYVQGTNPGIWSLHDHSGASGMGSTTANDYAFPGGMKTLLVYEDFDPPGELPAPEPGGVAGDYVVYAPSYGYP